MKNAPTIGTMRKATGGGAVAQGHRLHDGERARGRRQAEADLPAGDHRGVVVGAHHAVGDEHGEQDHHHGLRREDHQQRAGEVGEVEELHRHQRHDQEQRQRHVADAVDRPRAQAEPGGEVRGVADHHAEQQAEHEVRQDESRVLHQAHQVLAAREAGEHDEQPIDQRARIDLVASGLLLGFLFHVFFWPGQLVALDQVLGDRAAEDRPQDQARGRGRHGELHHALQVHRLAQAPGVGRAGAVPADERDRAAEQPDHRMQVERERDADAD